jgi:hypothetical protein
MHRSRRFLFPWTKSERMLCALVSFRHHDRPSRRASHPQPRVAYDSPSLAVSIWTALLLNLPVTSKQNH